MCVPEKERAVVAGVLFLSNTGDNPTLSTKPNTHTLVSWSHSTLLRTLKVQYIITPLGKCTPNM